MASDMAAKRRSGGALFSLSCGCNDSKSISVSDSSDRSSATPRRPRDPPSTSSAEALTLTSASTTSSSPYVWPAARPPPPEEKDESFSGLLRELGELERSVMALPAEDEQARRRERRRRSRSEGGSGKVEESVAVVRETDDPLGDFRMSMLQMIIEKEIVDGDELRELLGRFLALNSPRHHGLILRAFAEIWSDVFAGSEAEAAAPLLGPSGAGDRHCRVTVKP